MSTSASSTREPKRTEKDAEVNIGLEGGADPPPHESDTLSHSVRTRVARSVKGYFFPVDPSPPKASVDDAEYTPEMQASFLSNLTFSWLDPLMKLGFARPLEAPDLWKLQDHRSSAVIADKILNSFEARQAKANAYNAQLASGEVQPAVSKRLWWRLTGNTEQKTEAWKATQTKKPSLARSVNDSIGAWFWWGGVFKIVGDMAEVTSPLLIKALINFVALSFAAHQLGEAAPSIGKGIGYAFGLLALQTIGFLANHHFYYRSASSGVLVRGGLITAIYSRSLRLTNRSRATISTGRLVNHISTDVTRLDSCCQYFHLVWTAPISIIVILIQLLVNLGPSALTGLAVYIFLAPVQAVFMTSYIAMRGKIMAWTDKRVKTLQEMLGGMKVIKYFTWEVPMMKRIGEFRRKEMGYTRSLQLILAANTALILSTPTIAAMAAFLVYAASGHSLNAANIFTSLSLFNLLRTPLTILPMSLGFLADAQNAVSRLQEVFEAELVTENLVIEPSLPNAVEVKAASFTWDVAPADTTEPAGTTKSETRAFDIQNISFSIPRGSLTAIVGPVGSGKTSLIQSLIGEMRRTDGTVKFGGSVGYCSQIAWIQNVTIRENVCFGRPFESDKYWKVVKDACLETDLNMFPNGDLTEVGEKGISLSGGQKQRLSIARTIYSDCDIMIFDDPFSALDAHTGASVFKNILLNATQGKTRVLVTHALHFLPQVDYIYSLADGRIAEHGTYDELMARNEGPFSRFVHEFSSKYERGDQEKSDAVSELEGEKAEDDEQIEKVVKGAQFMQEEERNTGRVSWAVYEAFLRAGNGLFLVPILLFTLVITQGTQVMSSYWLVYWEENKWNRPTGFYMGVYAALGVGQALTNFVMGMVTAFTIYFAAQRLHHDALKRVMYAPMSFFETTPLGRIMNRFSKDVDTLDNVITSSLSSFLTMAASVIGAFILIAVVLPWFLIAVAVCAVLYAIASMYYRASAVEIQRLDALLRSSLYSHFSESLAGLATIRAYGEFDRFYRENGKLVDIENRAYWLTTVNQRWLGMRLDFFGTILTFVVAILSVGTRFTISPAQTGLILSYVLQVQMSFGWLIRQLAQVENDMNAVERIVYYAEKVEQEAPHDVADHKPPPSWPSAGTIELNGLAMKYRPELPPVLKGITLSVASGEKIGIVGRTGAGKSSVMVALFRIVEAMSGSMIIDGADISKLGLHDVRNALSIIPQDAILFSGTLRSNLDPFGLHDDAKLWDALRRSYLADDPKLVLPDSDPGGGTDPPTGRTNRFDLDSKVDEEGGNLSVGQRSLVSLARALVKDSKILILDEATASVDYETDRNIQKTIATEFQDRTILCIAHRLRTIIGYDRICVLDAGQITELDTPENLYHVEGGIFRGMCERSGISLDDLRRAVTDGSRKEIGES